MSKWDKLIEKILSGEADANIRFDDISTLLQRLGYRVFVQGSHHIYKQADWPTVNLQPFGAYVKPYQVKQIRIVLIAKGYFA